MTVWLKDWMGESFKAFVKAMKVGIIIAVAMFLLLVFFGLN